jgi:DNA-binding NarL/FixJ family response regulator
MNDLTKTGIAIVVLQKHRVILIDDHEIVRAGLSAVINAEPDLLVVGQQSDAQSGLASIETHKPDVVVVDINMPGASVFDTVQSALRSLPNLKVIFLTAFSSDSNLERAMQCGASGFITKSESLSTIVNAIREVVAGRQPFFSDDVRGRIISSPRANGASALNQMSSIAARRSLLSAREQEILCCVAQGQSAKQIATLLNISAKTVERHKSNIMTKLHLHTQVELTRYAIREGMIAP